ncbi:MAG: hypothetical protein CMM07_27155, partial [Rhodopirellula sp.]|nr:hypothetical protein [Rhodopirellula sp.]
MPSFADKMMFHTATLGVLLLILPPALSAQDVTGQKGEKSADVTVSEDKTEAAKQTEKAEVTEVKTESAKKASGDDKAPEKKAPEKKAPEKKA